MSVKNHRHTLNFLLLPSVHNNFEHLLILLFFKTLINDYVNIRNIKFADLIFVILIAVFCVVIQIVNKENSIHNIYYAITIHIM